MGIFNIFFRGKKQNLDDISSISNRIFELSNEEPSKRRTVFDIRNEVDKLYQKLSKILFSAVKTNDLNTVSEVITNHFIDKSRLLSDEGYNVIEYSLFTGNNELFKYLFNNFYKELSSCFTKIPTLFTIILNKKNIELLEFFVKNDNLSAHLKKENVTNCLFLALQSEQKSLSDLIVKNFDGLLDARNIEASMIYSIAHNQQDQLRVLFSYPTLINKFTNHNVEKMLALSVLNQNTDALEIMVSNQHFIKIMENADRNMIKSILQIAYSRGNIAIINAFRENNLLDGNSLNVKLLNNEIVSKNLLDAGIPTTADIKNTKL